MKTILFLCFSLLICLSQVTAAPLYGLVSPANNAVAISLHPVFIWHTYLNAPNTYYEKKMDSSWIDFVLMLSETSDFTGNVFNITPVYVKDTVMDFSSTSPTRYWDPIKGATVTFSIKDNTTYYWKVKDNGNAGYSGTTAITSPVWSFTTIPATSVRPMVVSAVKSTSGNVKYYDIQGRAVAKPSLSNIYIKQTGNTVSKEVLWNCSRKTSR